MASDVGSALVEELGAAGLVNAEEVGRGGFGIVYRCTQARLDRQVAVKVLTANLDEHRPRFVREQRAMGRLTGHPNIVSVLQTGETPSGFPYFVMPYHPRGSLQDWLRADGALRVEQVLSVGVKMAGALESAHQLGVLHRDVKPTNILLTDYGEPALTDFGIAHMADAFKTQTGFFTGTPAYTAPELLSGEPPSAASDVFALAATMFCALTGRPPFERRSGESLPALFMRIANDSVPDLRATGVPGDVAAVIEGAMNRDRHARPSVVDFGEALSRLQESLGLPVDEMALQTPQPHRTAERAIMHSTPRGVGGRLPAQLTSFVGRRRELAEVQALLDNSRMVTIAGVGGVGKTTLAVQVARAQQQSVPDGVWLIELADLTDGALLTEVTAAAVGVRDQSGRPLIGVLIDFLHPREVLLVLDNCEHLVEAAAQFTETLLRNCPRLKILTTSREILGIPGESVLPLAPLACPRHDDTPALTTLSGYDSVQLFVERARAAVPGFNLSERNAAAVLRICTQLDGLPLALELAAARLRAMSVRHIADGLAEGYGLLSHTRRGAPHRQQTLRGCVRWSFDLCTPQEQQLWARLSVFSGGFELAAAQYVCGGDIDAQEVFDLVAALVDKSILIRSETGDTVRYRLLESLRDYGKARLAEATGNYPQLARRHLEWYRRLLADATPHWWGPQHMERLLHISADMANVREALQFALTDAPAAALDMVSHLRPLWTTRGMLSEGHRWATMALDATATEVNTQRIQALFHAAVLAGMRGELPSARRSIDTARGHLVMVADASGQAAIDAVDGFVALQEGQLDRARTCLQSALRTGQDIEVRAVSLMLMGWTQAICGDIDEAVTWSEKALALAESHGDLVHRSQALANIGAGRWLNGQWSQAHDLMREGLQIAQLLNDTWTGAQLVEMLAWIYAEQDARRATTLMAAAAALSGLSGAPAIPYAQVGAFHADCEHRCRQQLGEAEYAAAWREGSALNFDQAVGVALADTAAASP